jgi:hypothetical protein
VEEEVAHSEPVRLEAGFMLIWRSVQWAVVFNSPFPILLREPFQLEKKRRDNIFSKETVNELPEMLSRKKTWCYAGPLHAIHICPFIHTKRPGYRRYIAPLV